MVLFGPMAFQHVLDISIERARNENDRPVPLRDVNYRSDQSDLGRSVTLTGEIRATIIPSVLLELERLRRFRDGVARTLDLEDGTTVPFTAKMGNLTTTITVGDWYAGRYFLGYTVDLLEA